MVTKGSGKSMVFDFSMPSSVASDCDTPMEVANEEPEEVTRTGLKESSPGFTSISSMLAESGKDLTQLVSDIQDEEDGDEDVKDELMGCALRVDSGRESGEEEDEKEKRNCSEEQGKTTCASISLSGASSVCDQHLSSSESSSFISDAKEPSDNREEISKITENLNSVTSQAMTSSSIEVQPIC